MVDLSMRNLSKGDLFDAICETPVCLPDAVQILTSCTIGNGRLLIMPFGKFAVTLYERYTGEGVRAYLDMKKIAVWPEVCDWYRKNTNKRNQELLLAQIKEAGHSLLSIQRVKVDKEKVSRSNLGPCVICPVCGEAYPVQHGDKCRSCQGESPYSDVVLP